LPEGEYALKYPRVSQETLRHEIIPDCADECAKKRAIEGWTGQQYRNCLKECIKRRVREWAKEQYGG